MEQLNDAVSGVSGCACASSPDDASWRALLDELDLDVAAYTDPENEAIIQESVARLVRGKTLIVIAHRLSTIVDADQIVVVNDGCIEATGTQAELLQACPLYETLWNAHIASRDSAEGGADRA